ncbi:MAG: phosphopantothenoylcysteine decarboxylase [Phycisphaerae bacterium]
MNLLITAGPTREYIDPVRYISNGSSGRMGYAVAAAAVEAGHAVTLLSGPVCAQPPEGVKLVPFVTVGDLQAALDEHFHTCDLLVMAAAVGDFTVAGPRDRKISRKAGHITLELTPTADLLGGLAGRKRPDQRIVAFAVEDGPAQAAQAKARAEMHAKGADWVVVNPPAAMESADSEACMLGPEGPVLPWARRDKTELARAILAACLP